MAQIQSVPYEKLIQAPHDTMGRTVRLAPSFTMPITLKSDKAERSAMILLNTHSLPEKQDDYIVVA